MYLKRAFSKSPSLYDMNFMNQVQLTKMIFVRASDEVEVYELPFDYSQLKNSSKMRKIPLSDDFIPGYPKEESTSKMWNKNCFQNFIFPL